METISPVDMAVFARVAPEFAKAVARCQKDRLLLGFAVRQMATQIRATFDVAGIKDGDNYTLHWDLLVLAMGAMYTLGIERGRRSKKRRKR
jgi:hypothetical protein